MTKPDDGALTLGQLANVQRHADRLLREAGAIGRFPTPVADILAAAKLTVIDDQLLDASLLSRFLHKAKANVATGLVTLKSALSKVLGIFEPHDRLVFLDKNIPGPRLPFVQLHEAGHGFLPHQSGLYALIHDCEKTLDPDTTDLFEREANVFASETLFQGSLFAEMAHDEPFALKVPMQLAKKIGASNYSTFRRYVESNPHICCVVVLEPVVQKPDGSFVAEVRRIVVSRTFDAIFDAAVLFSAITQNHPLAGSIPLYARRMSKQRGIILTDRNQEKHECVVESFDTKHQILVLVRDAGLLKTSIILPRVRKRLSISPSGIIS
ncbi:MAG: ImmA/IrrE family metallo-endopeptidase [Proteobacteria bacterium]|nr:ImmA/IrrE family metallo-endopeptidase [Pseudomonadota bacterium]